MRRIFFILGIISFGGGIVGIFLPLLPTTPFLLFATYCFSRSSERFYRYILNNRIFGKYIKDYRDKKGITVKNKIAVLSLLACGIGYSFTKVTDLYMRLILIVVFIGVTWHILTLKTLK